ncbi:enoyl-CoA hydratase/isomerase family protein [Trujillonella endophytica]|uniref:Enoyl-CoA hydratase/isomerase n=1 Tax=Trujillonella endophytica TaxID=673521 RepID=A0A1H8RXJ4_9ACTN|nr:enoyl-CoA hydratase/isomerase family protein [Trujillella endophytica]SEO70924.1 Enoyl-CoA hydratase/isomerase [Trujillella endophytica]
MPAQDTDATVVVERVGAVLSVELDRPDKLNAASPQLQADLNAALRAAAADDDVRAVVLSGRGRGLSSGGDTAVLEQLVTGTAAEELQRELSDLTAERLRLAFAELVKPLVVAVHGFAIGWGAELVAMADVAVMDDDAYLQEPHARFGIAPAPACELVWSRFVPPGVLTEILGLGRRVPADEALRWGLVARVVPAGSARTAALELAAELAQVPASGLAAVKRAVHREVVARLA